MNDINYATEAQLGEILGKVKSDYAQKDGIYPDLVAGNLVDPKAQGVPRSIQFDTAAGDASINDDGTAVIQSIHGNTENPNQIAPDTGEFNSQSAFNFAPSGNYGLGGTTMTDKIVGGTIAWNQLVQNGNFESAYGWSIYKETAASLAIENNKAVVTYLGAASVNYEQGLRCSLDEIIISHKYIVTVTVKCSANVGIRLEVGSRSAIQKSVYIGSKATISITYNAANKESDTISIYPINILSAGSTLEVSNVMLFDLTAMFGPTIADYVYSLEQATAGAGVAWFKKLFPKPYYEYNAGELMSVCTNEHITRGFNQWDEEWELGRYDTNTGEPVTSTSYIRSKNAIKVIPKAIYYAKRPGALNLLYYQDDGSFINSETRRSDFKTFSPPEGCTLVRFHIETTYNPDICINLYGSGYRSGEYEPYVEHNYPLSPVELRGIPKLDSANNLYFDGDTYEKDGTVTRKYGIVDLGTLNWVKSTSPQRFEANASLQPHANPEIINTANAVCAKYECYPYSQIYDKDFAFFINNDGALRIYDSSLYSLSASGFKATMSGVYLVYELATPTTETANPFTDPQVVDDFGTEEYVDALATAETNPRDVTIPAGRDAVYNVTHHTVNLISSHKYLFRDKSAGTDTVITGQTTQVVDTGADGSGDILIDLTKWFGAGNEPVSAAALYYIYPLLRGPVPETNVLKHYVGTGIKTVGFNQFNKNDLTIVNNYYLNDYGVLTPSTASAYTSNKIPVFPNSVYNRHGVFTQTPAQNSAIYFFDADGNWISRQIVFGNDIDITFTTPENCHYIGLQFINGAPNWDEVCINLSWSGYHNGEYKSYWSSVLDLPITSILKAMTNAYIVGSTEFGAAWLSLIEGGGALVPATGVFYRVKTIGDHYNKIYKWTGAAYAEAGETETKPFPDGMKSAGTVYDEVTKTKAIKRIGMVDLGTLTWFKYSDARNTTFRTDDIQNIRSVTVGTRASIICSMYDVLSWSLFSFGNNTMALDNTRLVITNDNYESAAGFKQAMSGVILYYELATPEEVEFETALDLTYRVNDFGTEQSLPEITSVIPNCSMLKAIIAYSTDMTRNLANLSKNAPMSNGTPGQVWTAGANEPGWANLPVAFTPLVITASTTFTQDSKILPSLTATDLDNIYEALGSGRNCVIISNNGQERFVVQQADKISGVTCVVFTHYHDSVITYENDGGITVTVIPI